MNTFGKLLRVTTFGESHGPAIGCVVDGCPPDIPLAPKDFVEDLARRATGKSRHVSQRHEPDEVEILSGVFEGITTGTPIALVIRNVDARSKDYASIAHSYRPGHADYTYDRKYGRRDPNGGGRSSARETAIRVAAGVIAKKWLRHTYGVEVRACVTQAGGFKANAIDWCVVEDNGLFWPNAAQVPALEAHLDALRKSGDSCGARVYVEALGVPAGWGEPLYGKLDAEIAGAMMSINAVKGVEIGAGFDSIEQSGSIHRDALSATGFETNHAGGILGGISSGQIIRVGVAFKPTSSLRIPVSSIDVNGQAVQVVTTGRHDPCVGLRAPPICEAMLALVLMDQAMRHRAQCGEVVHDTPGMLPGSYQI